MAARGGGTSRPTMRCRPRCWSAPARIASIIDFINVDQANGDLFPMYEQVRRALAWVCSNAASFGGDRGRIYISAHSSGSHLAGVVLTRGWQEEGLPPDAFKGAVLLSGMYDLAPVAAVEALVLREVHRRHGAQAQRAAVSSTGFIRRSFSLIGTCETPEFQRQSRDFAAAVKAAGKPARTDRRRRLQSFRIARDARQPLWSDRARHARADATGREIRRRQ